MTTPAAVKSSLVLILNADRERDFGTGFIIEQTGIATRVVTCRHVVFEKNVPKTLRIGEGSHNVILLAAGSDSALDLAVIEITPPLAGLPIPLVSNPSSDLIALKGFCDGGEAILRRPALGTIRKPADQISWITGEEVRGWEFQVEENHQLEPGNSGSPVLDRSFCAAFGVANAKDTTGLTGLIVALSELPRIWAPAAGLFLDKRIILFAHSNDSEVVDALLVSLNEKIGRDGRFASLGPDGARSFRCGNLRYSTHRLEPVATSRLRRDLEVWSTQTQAHRE